jgi:hypothetical protein
MSSSEVSYVCEGASVRGVCQGSALALVQLLHGQPGEGEDADADKDQQDIEEDLHGVLLD